MDQENRMPLIGDKAPSFEAVTTQGPIKFPEDYAGKWVILFSHPADFTPVCTTEFMTFGSMIDEFKALNTELVGLSVDSIYSHIAWLRKIQELEWNGKKHINVTFPLIEDIRMEVANKYGMIQPGQSNTQAVRAVFVIDPNGVVRTILYYPRAATLTRSSASSWRSRKRTPTPAPPRPTGDPAMMSSYPPLAAAA